MSSKPCELLRTARISVATKVSASIAFRLFAGLFAIVAPPFDL